MAGGLAALLDDIAAMARLAASSMDDVAAGAARASTKTAGVVVDDAAVTPQYLTGVTPASELPMIKRIALGSLRNKLFIVIGALLMSEFLPWLLTPLLMLGGCYLAFEGAEKVWERVSGHGHGEGKSAEEREPKDEDSVVRSAVTTDFILSCEILVIALNEVAEEPFLTRAMILVVVGIAMTAVVYGAVAILVKMDDVGLALTKRDSSALQSFGRGLVAVMPKVMVAISFIGMLAMLWVGGHILLVGTDDLGWHGLYELVHRLADPMTGVAGVGGFLAWLVETVCSMIIGLLVGAVIVLVMHLLPFGKDEDAGHGSHKRALATTA